MTIYEALPHAAKLLSVSTSASHIEAEVLLGFALKRDRTWLVVHPTMPLAARTLTQFWNMVNRRARDEPLAYITGRKEFYGRPFYVNPSVMIPRPETEELVRSAIEYVHRRKTRRLTVIDLGTGSGVIAVTLAREEPSLRVIATDVSARALGMVRKNAALHGVAKRITFLKSDLLASVPIPKNSVIVANLPYLPESDRKTVAPEIRNFEPARALFAGRDGLAVIRRLLSHIAKLSLKPQALFLEIDPRQRKRVVTLASRYLPHYTCSLLRDVSGRDRIVQCQRIEILSHKGFNTSRS
ncbi:MAG: peptide chain release factor N(5)-glutamine methyltransferase [Parcubacteria group bacterium]|nr:peptide chain release factor N(5)-glutamine methyltransferase [Parcubacteria group bacterium]